MERESANIMFRAVKHGIHKGSIDAIFIDQCDSYTDSECVTCYAHIGQHSSASLAYVYGSTRPAKESEYRDLLSELQSIGYDVTICKRDRPAFRQARLDSVQQYRKNGIPSIADGGPWIPQS